MKQETTHYYTEKQQGSYAPIPLKFYLKKRKIEVSIFSAPGIFSSKKLDKGSALLINESKIEKDWKVLDMGCGYGAVGISLALYEPSLIIDLCDVNERAIEVTTKNVKEKSLTSRTNVYYSNTYQNVKLLDYDTILINPPQTAGKKVCEEMIIGAKKHLRRGGLVQVVARHQKGGKAFEKLLNETYGNVETVAKKSGFRIYASKKK
ncbi:class I SAM-dependent methyltransferase [Candidatus Woesearchaeota archaeon]|nr:class I SAM-dependent methyltransferase [Candidatus Woesearchaeota archaeon]